ncbi:MAG: ParA family protein [Sphingobacteriia bacterium]|nr:ParA family protein [Sphingobacteriia bacterium]
MSAKFSKVIAVVNQKGGVAKTTTAVNLATAFAAVNLKTLIIDLDPQGNASTGLNIQMSDRRKNIYRVLINEVSSKESIKPSIVPNLYIIPSCVDLSAAEIELINLNNREYLLKKSIKEVIENYDKIIIDCPPSLGLLTINALAAADSIVIPLQCEFFALEGLAHLLKTIELVKNNINRKLDILGVLLTMYDRRNRLTEEVEKDVRECLQDKVFTTVIPRNIKLSEAPSHGLPALIYDHKCSGSQAYAYLAKEILDKEKIITTNTTEESIYA